MPLNQRETDLKKLDLEEDFNILIVEHIGEIEMDLDGWDIFWSE